MEEEYLNNCTPDEEERIDRILRAVEIVWKENPELRFCQLISNCFSTGEDLYYKYDEEVVEALFSTYM